MASDGHLLLAGIGLNDLRRGGACLVGPAGVVWVDLHPCGIAGTSPAFQQCSNGRVSSSAIVLVGAVRPLPVMVRLSNEQYQQKRGMS